MDFVNRLRVRVDTADSSFLLMLGESRLHRYLKTLEWIPCVCSAKFNTPVNDFNVSQICIRHKEGM